MNLTPRRLYEPQPYEAFAAVASKIRFVLVDCGGVPNQDAIRHDLRKKNREAEVIECFDESVSDRPARAGVYDFETDTLPLKVTATS